MYVACPKNALQEYFQRRQLPLPHYTLLDQSGFDHAPIFTVEVAQETTTATFCGKGSTKKAAENVAAALMLQALGEFIPIWPAPKNPKNQLQEWIQARHGTLPNYKVVRSGGDDHAPRFHADLYIDGVCLAIGEGGTNKEAECAAAAECWRKLIDAI